MIPLVIIMGVIPGVALGSFPAPRFHFQAELVPLAYVRTLAILPAIIRLPAPAPLPSPPPSGDKRGLARWNALKAERARLGNLRAGFGGRILESLSSSLGKLPGLSVNYLEAAVPRGSAPASAADRVEAILPTCKYDAVLQPVLDGFIVRSGLQREIWVRISGVLGKPSHPGSHGNFAAFGKSASAPSLFGLTATKPDEELVDGAIDQAAKRLTHTLDSGEEQLFARRSRICIVPAAVTSSIHYSAEDSGGPASHTSEPVSRLADVLLQPEIGPFATFIEPDDIEAALQTLKLDSAQFWRSDGSPDMESVQAICKLIRINYLFISRVSDIAVTDTRIDVLDTGMERAGIERRAEVTAAAALIRISDMKTVWTDEETGTTTSRTEYVRHNPRIVRESQCAADAARVAYARLRYSLEEFQKRFDRRH